MRIQLPGNKETSQPGNEEPTSPEMKKSGC